MPTWDPGQYLKFADHRLRPALDLMARIPLEAPRSVYDLGCGPGNVTRLLSERWPGATVTGVDSSPDMLAQARREALHSALQQADIAGWSPPAPADLLFTNATLHWLDDHARLLGHLISHLAPGGVLAVQMPRNHTSPSHVLIEETAANGPWVARLANIRRVYRSVETAEAYYRILAPLTRQLDIWETEYLHVLPPTNPVGDSPVVAWTKGTALRPYLEALDEPERAKFHDSYAARIAAAYPPQPDGKTLLSFNRIFIVAQV
jgi:trans-aconitate 2-methyltransferase